MIEITVPDRFADRLAAAWPVLGLARVERPPRAAQRRLEMRSAVGGTLLLEVDAAPVPGGWERVESELAVFAAERLATQVAVHAAVVVHGERALVLPGPSRAGKSTLCVAAVDAGAAVLSDEYALVDVATGLVTGWNRPVRVRRDDGTVERRDLATASGPLTVGLVALVHYQPGASTELVDVAAADAVLGLLANILCAQSRPDEAFDAALSVARSCPSVAGARGEAEAAIQVLLERLQEAPARR